MKVQYCWRCSADVPMLDEVEYAEVRAIYDTCYRAAKSYRTRRNAPLDKTPLAELYKPVQQAYGRITGVVGFDPHHILKHRIADFGPPCANCGRPLRTPDAQMCASCGAPGAA
jgi:hypothetical protein